MIWHKLEVNQAVETPKGVGIVEGFSTQGQFHQAINMVHVKLANGNVEKFESYLVRP